MTGALPLLIPLLSAVAPVAAVAPETAQTVTAEQALANFEEQFRLARAGICRSGPDPDEVVICGQRLEDSPYRIASSTRVPGYREQGPAPLFQFNFGPVRVSCCAISTGNGSGAGLSLSTSF